MTELINTSEDDDMVANGGLQRRDLRYAQMPSMMAIWDNPADERWNDEAPPPGNAYGSGPGMKADAPQTDRK